MRNRERSVARPALAAGRPASLCCAACGRSSVVEHQLPKLSVVGSIPIARSKLPATRHDAGDESHDGGDETMREASGQRRRAWSWWYLLFVIQFIAVMWPPFYNRAEP